MRTDIAHVHHSSNVPIQDPPRALWFDDDSEWEYEYDDDETEDLFFTLDLTTHLPEALTKRESAKNGRWARGTLEARVKRPKGKAKPKAPLDLPSIPSIDRSSQAEQSPGPGTPQDTNTVTVPDDDADEDEVEAEAAAEDRDAPGSIQFVGLETPTPYLKYNDEFYSGYWLSDLGTQIWICKHGASKSTLRQGFVLDVIGASQTRLVARPASYALRDGFTDSDAMIADNAVVPFDNRSLVKLQPEPHGPFKQPHQLTDPFIQTHASFMEKWSGIKWQRGERDHMPYWSHRTYEIPKDAADIRARALRVHDEGTANSTKLDDGTTPGTMPLQNGMIPTEPVRVPQKRSYNKRKRVSEPVNDNEEDGDDDAANEGIPPAHNTSTRGRGSRGRGTSTRGGRGRAGAPTKSSRLQALGLESMELPKPVVKRGRRTKAQIEADKLAALERHPI